jgi:autotransporter-associated beta strand protein
LEPLEDRLAPAVVDWISATAGSWNNNANWFNETSMLNQAPGAGDVATFSAAQGLGDSTVDKAFSVQGINIESDYTGTITVSAALTIGTAGLIVSAGTFDLNGNNLSVPSLTGSGTITNNSSSAGAMLTVTNSAADLFSGSLTDGSSNPLALTVAGSNTLTLSGSNSYSGATTVNSGATLAAGGTGKFSLNSALTVNGKVDLISFSQTVAGLSGSGTVTTSGALALLTINVTANDLFTGSLTGTSGGGAGLFVTKQGSSTLTLSFTNTCDQLTITAGTVQVDGNSSSTSVILDGGTLGGRGSVGLITETKNGGTVNPGDSGGTGTLTASNPTLNSTATYHADISSTGNDLLTSSSGTISVGGATLNVALLGGYLPSGVTFTIVSATGGAIVTGTFVSATGDQLAEGGVVAAGSILFQIHYTTTAITLTAGTVFNYGFPGIGPAPLDANWQIPPLPLMLHYTYRRRLGFGGFQVLNNKAVSVGPSFDAEKLVSPSLSSVSVQADVNAAGSGTLMVGLMARLQSNGDAYVAVLTRTGTAEILFYDGPTQTFTVLASKTGAGTSANLTFQVIGSSLSLYLNSSATPFLTVTDSTLTSAGGIGIFAQGVGGTVVNFSDNGF